jgi:hypothetical protein
VCKEQDEQAREFYTTAQGLRARHCVLEMVKIAMKHGVKVLGVKVDCRACALGVGSSSVLNYSR